MNSDNPKIEFINHASVLISNENISVLSDPWYQGDAFHKGWNLLHELDDMDIDNLLDKTTHIWISHEHPDHFSIMFFKKFENKIKEKNIEILFQQTADKRVESFLSANKFKVRILKPNKWIKISENFSILNFKDGFYDSGLALNVDGKKFLNLNDCEVKTKKRCKEVFDIVGECDVLISQFSYAAWKGGKNNLKWREKAASEKLKTLTLQTEYFKPKLLIPFASYIYFSNELNFYLNDSANTPVDVINHFKDSNIKVKVMKPFEIISDFTQNEYNNNDALNFWNNIFKKLNAKNRNTFEIIDIDRLNESFQQYKSRIFKNNSKLLIRLLRYLSPVPAFRPLAIELKDINKTIIFDIFSKQLECTDSSADVIMSSESLYFIMNNTFGFDTLTVNGCFEENREGGFSRMTRIMALENLNNIGIQVKPSIIFRLDIISMFLLRLLTVTRKIRNSG